jgi:pimeloyl-ACP methyl ester carboxylesterase
MLKTGLVIFYFFIYLPLLSQSVGSLKETTNFNKNNTDLDKENIKYYYLSVPENYENPEGKKIELAVAVIHSIKETNNPVLFVQGGPGGSTISTIGYWLEHPLREKSDIILTDLRGTGFSKPTLCPDLGKKFFEVLSKNQNKQQDEANKVKLAIECQQDLINRGIDINAYNSLSVAKDLNTLKRLLKVEKWNVYGVSFGTFISQQYARIFPNDVKSLILDSSIPEIENYYTQNTSNYTNSLNTLFRYCKNDSLCNKKYPDLQEKYYSVIENLEKDPITVPVDKTTLPSGKFTYNAEDFKIAIHQSLYQRKLIEILPLIIYEFSKRNEKSLSALVSAFAGALSLDYGVYYCFTCNEVIPKNNISEFTKDALKDNRIKGGLSFYESDFSVCSAWNQKGKADTTILNTTTNNSFQTIVFSGEFDPIIPASASLLTTKKYNNCLYVPFALQGHCPGFSEDGSNIINKFVNESFTLNDSEKTKAEKIQFITNISMNKGVFKFANSLTNFDWIFFSPLIFCFFSLISFMVHFGINRKGLSNKTFNGYTFFICILALLSIGVLGYAVVDTSKDNFYMLAFGLPKKYSFVFTIFKILIPLTACFWVIYLLLRKKNKSTSQFFPLVGFSITIILIYLFYWGFWP